MDLQIGSVLQLSDFMFRDRGFPRNQTSLIEKILPKVISIQKSNKCKIISRK